MAVYYVSSTGNDSNDGLTTGTSWQTLSKVNSVAFNAGDQILFNKGDTFYGSLTTTRSGTSGFPISYGAYGTGLNPIITGFVTVTSWTNLGSNIWESTNVVSSLSQCNMVLIGGVNTPMGRYPKATDTNKGYYTYQSHSGRTSITSSNLTGTPNWTGAEVVIRNQAFHFKRSTVTSQSSSTINFNDIGDDLSDGNGFFFQNDDRCLTQQNDWHYIASTGKLRVYSTTTPTNVKIAAIDTLITINSNYLSFSNISFTGANSVVFWKQPNTGFKTGLTITNCSFSYIGISAAYVYVNNFTFSNNTVTECNTNAIDSTASSNSVISYNTISNIGLYPGMKYIQGLYGANCAIDFTTPTTMLVEYNTISNIGFNGIAFNASTDVTIRNNFIDTYCQILDDGGGIYSYAALNSFFSNIKIYNNICINGIAAIEGSAWNVHHAHGIYLDRGSSNFEISYNTCANLEGSGLYISSSGNNYIHHNTCYNGTVSALSYQYFGGDAPVPTGDVINHNILVAKTAGGTKTGYATDLAKAIYIYFSNSSLIPSAFTSDYNYIARPIDDDYSIFVTEPNPLLDQKTLEDWRAYLGYDMNSSRSSQSITTVNDFQFEYNNTTSDRTVTLSQAMIDIPGNKYTGQITIAPFSSVVLMKDANPGASVPPPPTNVVATAGNASATVSFTPPLSDGGSAITGYTVISTPGNISTSGSNSPIVVPNLVNGTSYTFIVRAVNTIGNSANSSPSAPVVPNANLGTLPKLLTSLGKSVTYTGKRIIIYV
jgi:parallel beta-helix repeat protein